MNQKKVVTHHDIEAVTIAKPGRLFPSGQKHLAQQSTAVLCRCQDCGVWWGSSRQYSHQDSQIFRVAEPHTDQFLWQDYRGWRHEDEANVCPECGK